MTLLIEIAIPTLNRITNSQSSRVESEDFLFNVPPTLCIQISMFSLLES